jgi:hypothetical protein
VYVYHRLFRLEDTCAARYRASLKGDFHNAYRKLVVFSGDYMTVYISSSLKATYAMHTFPDVNRYLVD